MSESVGLVKKIKVSLLSLGAGILASVLFLALFSVLVSNISMPHSLFTLFSTVALVIGSLVSGLISGAVYKRKGSLCGVIGGLLLYAVIFLVSLFVSGQIGVIAVLKLVICAVSGAAGGIIGVNRG